MSFVILFKTSKSTCCWTVRSWFHSVLWKRNDDQVVDTLPDALLESDLDPPGQHDNVNLAAKTMACQYNSREQRLGHGGVNVDTNRGSDNERLIERASQTMAVQDQFVC